MSLPPLQLHCSICYPTDQEVIALLHNLANRIYKQEKTLSAQKFLKITSSAEQKTPSTESGVQKLIQFMFINKLQPGQTCKHEIVRKFLLLKTRLNENRVEMICQRICQFQAKRNYELDILMSQVKCFSKSIGEELYRKNKKQILSSAKSEPLVKKEEERPEEKEIRSFVSEPELYPVEHPAPPIMIPYYFPAYQSIPFASFYPQIN